MALNIVSNYAAQVAHRNLQATDTAASASLAKLSSGTRVVSAKDDAASLAIGSRLNTEVQSLKQASVNAGQASSMLQIADGAMAKVGDILTRMKTLAVQASSDQVSATERGMLNTEYQSLTQEIDRIAQVTKFNGTTLVNGSTSTTTTLNAQSNANNLVQAADGFTSVSFGNSVGDATFQTSYDSTTKVLTMTNLTTGVSQGIDLGSAAIEQNGKQVVNFSQLDTVVTLNSAFNKNASILPTGTAAITGTGSIQDSTIKVTGASAGVQALTGNTVTVDATTAATSTLSIGGYTGTADLSAAGTKSVTLTNGTDSISVEFTVDTALVDGDAGTMTLGGLGSLTYGTATTSSDTSFTFKVGSGTTANVDTITIGIGSVSTAALGVNGGDITTAANADTAITAISGAIDALNTARANIGSAQNRMQFASDNLATSIENQEAARSSLLDLDVASEMTNFTSKQILMQAGISMLAQANQMPNQLLKILG